MTRIGDSRQTLSQVVDRLGEHVEHLVKVVEVLDLNGFVARPYDPTSPEAARAHGRNLAMAYEGDQLAQALVDVYADDAELLSEAFVGAGIAPPSDAPAPVDLEDARSRLRALRAGLRAG